MLLVSRGTMGVNSLPKTVTRQRRDCDLNPGPSAPVSSMLTIRLPCHLPGHRTRQPDGKCGPTHPLDGRKHKQLVKIRRVVPEICSQTDRLTYISTCSSTIGLHSASLPGKTYVVSGGMLNSTQTKPNQIPGRRNY